MRNGVFQTGNPRWSAVFSLFMGVMALIAAEFIPVSLLTPIARDLAVTEGMAGQTVTAVGVFAVLTSLLLAPLTGNIDRRRILLAFSAMLAASYMPEPVEYDGKKMRFKNFKEGNKYLSSMYKYNKEFLPFEVKQPNV